MNAIPNADQPCTIIFKPASDNPLYGHSGELYGHFGVVVDGEWKYVPSDWGVADEKVHFKKVADNHWEFKMEPSIREYFGSGEANFFSPSFFIIFYNTKVIII